MCERTVRQLFIYNYLIGPPDIGGGIPAERHRFGSAAELGITHAVGVLFKVIGFDADLFGKLGVGGVGYLIL